MTTIPEDATTWANATTAIRTALALLLGLAAIDGRDATLLLLAYAAYWFGDMLDGWLARRRDEETRLGAVVDIISDRACSAVLVCGLVVIKPALWPALTVFLLQFLVLDCLLSLSFLHWPGLLSPNYFYRVDSLTWRLNWSIPAKLINTAGVTLVVLTGQLPFALVLASAQLALKVWSTHRVLGLSPTLALQPC
jgi:phosphatidylglycerophosphate synthase